MASIGLRGSGRQERSARSAAPWLAATCLALLALGSGCGGGPSDAAAAAPAEPDEPEAEAIAVEARPAWHSPMSALYSTSATLRADRQATVTARTQGIIRQLLVEEGDRVSAGQALAVLEDDEQRIRFESAATTRDIHARELERAENLLAQGLLSEEEFGSARRQAEETRHAAELAELELSRTVIRAPFGGLILTRQLDTGATVSDGTAVYELADLDPLYADVNVPERHVVRLAVAQSVRLNADAAQRETVARIERIAPLVDAATGTVKVTLTVAGAEGLRPGTFVRVEIVTDTHEHALVVPRTALVAEGRRWHLFRVGDDRHVERLEVERGYEEDDRVEILFTRGEVPLQAGDSVVHVGAAALTDGALVDPVGEQAPAASGA